MINISRRASIRTAGFFLAALIFTCTAQAAEYKIDPDHSTIAFKVKHLGISSVPGRFTDFTGNISFDPASVKDSKAEAKIQAKSISTDNAKRDAHLRNPDFFDVEKFPELSFKTTGIEVISADSFKAHGDLTLHGVTKPVTLSVQYGGSAKDHRNIERAAFTATTMINRKDFGLAYNKLLETGGLVVGDEVSITLEIEAIRQG